LRGGGGIIYKSTNGGFNWSDITPTPPFGLCNSICFVDALTGWIGFLSATPPETALYQTTNGGINWTPVTGLPFTAVYGLSSFSVVNQNTIYACGNYMKPAVVLKTTNKGVNWISLSVGGLAEALVDCKFFSPDSGFVFGSIGDFFALTIKPVILFTSDGGNSWVVRHTGSRIREWCYMGSFPSRNVGYAVVEHDEQQTTLSTIFLKTTNGGVNWTEKQMLPYYTDLEGAGFVNESTGWMGGGFYDSTYQTTNGGDNWVRVNWGAALNRFQFLNDTLGFAVGHTVYKWSRDNFIGILKLGNEIPEKYSLSQNYPNPFNPATKIKFDITAHSVGQTYLSVYDALGREIATLVNEKLNPGKYEVTFDGSNLTSGIYYYILKSGNYTETKKMVMIK
jgi:photosystem II stability/assembly factor-like uncharacterized protein